MQRVAMNDSGWNDRMLEPGLRARMRSEERRIEGQHHKLNTFLKEIAASLDENGPRAAINDFLLFEAALDAHLTIEESVYFPALHGLQVSLADDLAILLRHHDQIREHMTEAKSHFKRVDTVATRDTLGVLKDLFEYHESLEEGLISRSTEGPTGGQFRQMFVD